MVEQYFKNWYKSRTGYNKQSDPNPEKYRVIGIDKSNTCNITACGYAKRFSSKTTYLSGSDCSKGYHVAAHEIGHTFGLCDEYNSFDWDKQNLIGLEPVDLSLGTCPNEKPINGTNTVFFEQCKGNILRGGENVCTYGVLIDSNKNIYSVMGSGDLIDGHIKKGVDIKRSFTEKSRSHINKKIKEASK